MYLSAGLSLALSSSLSPCKAASLRRHVSFNGVHIHTGSDEVSERGGGKANSEVGDIKGRTEKLFN